MKKISRFKLSYLIFLGACILLSAAFLIYVSVVISDYDKAQPERLVEQQKEWLSARAADGTLAAELDFERLCSNRYENNDAEAFGSAYTDKIKGAALTYEYAAIQSSELSKSYNILADGSPVGTLFLSGKNSRSRLFFFSMADWSVDSFQPVVSDTVYNLTVYQPEGTEVLINGCQPSPDELDPDSSTPAYSIKGLLNEPSIEYRRANGDIVPFTTDNNVIKPVLFSFDILAPEGITVSVNGTKISGEPAANGDQRYNIREMTKPSVTFTDLTGDTREYRSEEDREFYKGSVMIPENCRLEINGIDADDIFKPVLSLNPDAEFLLDQAGVELPNRKTYEISLVRPGAKAVVTDENGSQREYALSGSVLEVSSLGGSEIPDDIAAQIDVMETTKNWSRFMTDDLPGEKHGLNTVCSFLIRDSDYYRFANEWATGIDISFTSAHSLDSFTGEKITNFTRYNDKCFSCEVYFEKNMSLYSGGRYAGARTDVFNSIMYFVYIDDTPDNGADDPHWAIAVMHDVI